jgi:hypothetical protein
MTTEYVSATRRPEERKPDAEQKPREQRGDGSAKQIPDQPTALASDSAEPDVLIDAPMVNVEEISLDVGDLRARVSLSARVGNLVTLDVGAEALLEKLKLTIKGVEARAQLKVRLQKVHAILERTLSTIDRNPEILGRWLAPVGEAAGAIGIARETVDAAPARRHDHARARRVLRPIETAARTCTTQARRAIRAARQAMRARRAAKAARHPVPSPETGEDLRQT